MQWWYGDDRITIRPTRLISETSNRLDNMTVENRTAALAYVRQYSNYFYARQDKPVPPDIQKQVDALDKAVTNRNVIDEARRFVDQHGKPREALDKFVALSQVRAPYLELRESRQQQQPERALAFEKSGAYAVDDPKSKSRSGPSNPGKPARPKRRSASA
jgi:hypothetical protein